MSEDRDILIEMRSDMKHVRERVEKLASNQEKQWEKIDLQGNIIEGHEKTLGFLVKGFWTQATAVVAVFGGIFAWLVKGDK